MSKYYVYLITNFVNGKVYIGKSNNPQVRWGDHRKVALGGKEKYPLEFFAIHAAIHKYGLNNFKFEIIDEFDNENEAYKAETQYILLACSNLKDFGYNCNLGGEGGIKPTEETRQKLIAAANRPEKIKLSSDMMKKRHLENPGFLSVVHKGNQYTKGRKLSQQEKDHLSEVFAGRAVSEETKQKNV
jgi:group I intron endonuclease